MVTITKPLFLKMKGYIADLLCSALVPLCACTMQISTRKSQDSESEQESD
jgi:hypothetical protein